MMYARSIVKVSGGSIVVEPASDMFADLGFPENPMVVPAYSFFPAPRANAIAKSELETVPNLMGQLVAFLDDGARKLPGTASPR